MFHFARPRLATEDTADKTRAEKVTARLLLVLLLQRAKDEAVDGQKEIGHALAVLGFVATLPVFCCGERSGGQEVLQRAGGLHAGPALAGPAGRTHQAETAATRLSSLSSLRHRTPALQTLPSHKFNHLPFTYSCRYGHLMGQYTLSGTPSCTIPLFCNRPSCNVS